MLTVLAAVCLAALADVRSRKRRNEWEATLNIAVILLDEAPVDEDALRALSDRAAAAEDRLALEHARYQPGRPRPFHFELFGPAHVSQRPPELGGDSLTELLVHTWELRRYVHHVDAALGVDRGRFDSRVYTTLRPASSDAKTHVEGQSETGGRVAQVRVELDASMVDLAWIVITHELLHTLGASDKYLPGGETRIPEGLADPDRSPRFPQDQVEVMARNRPLAADREVIPTTLAELGVGPLTAREIGWLP